MDYPYERAWNYALWLLTRKARSKAELQERLHKKGATPEDITRVIEKLEALHYLDDAGFAEAYVSSRKRKKGRIAIAQELSQKGVPPQLREEALQALDDDTQLEAAKELLEKNRWRWEGKQQARAKAFAFLARRGFPGEIAQRALEASGFN